MHELLRRILCTILLNFISYVIFQLYSALTNILENSTECGKIRFSLFVVESPNQGVEDPNNLKYCKTENTNIKVS